MRVFAPRARSVSLSSVNGAAYNRRWRLLVARMSEAIPMRSTIRKTLILAVATLPAPLFARGLTIQHSRRSLPGRSARCQHRLEVWRRGQYARSPRPPICRAQAAARRTTPRRSSTRRRPHHHRRQQGEDIQLVHVRDGRDDARAQESTKQSRRRKRRIQEVCKPRRATKWK